MVNLVKTFICTDDSSTHIIVVVDLNHWSIHTGTQAFHFYYSEHLVWSSLPKFDTCGEPNGETLHISASLIWHSTDCLTKTTNIFNSSTKAWRATAVSHICELNGRVKLHYGWLKEQTLSSIKCNVGSSVLTVSLLDFNLVWCYSLILFEYQWQLYIYTFVLSLCLSQTYTIKKKFVFICFHLFIGFSA